MKYQDERINNFLKSENKEMNLIVVGSNQCGLLEKAIQESGIKIVNSLGVLPIVFVSVNKNNFEKLLDMSEIIKVELDEIHRP